MCLYGERHMCECVCVCVCVCVCFLHVFYKLSSKRPTYNFLCFLRHSKFFFIFQLTARHGVDRSSQIASGACTQVLCKGSASSLVSGESENNTEDLFHIVLFCILQMCYSALCTYCKWVILRYPQPTKLVSAVEENNMEDCFCLVFQMVFSAY